MTGETGAAWDALNGFIINFKKKKNFVYIKSMKSNHFPWYIYNLSQQTATTAGAIVPMKPISTHFLHL